VSPTTEARAVRSIEAMGAAAAIAVAQRLGEDVTGPLLDRVLRRMAERHPRAFATLGELPEAVVLIDPLDQPAAIALTVGPSVSVRIVEREGAEAQARIRGPLAALMDLMEGRIDGDALFFRRELKIDGDTELVVAVRNAFDGEDMDLAADLAAAFGPFDRLVDPARAGVERMARLAERLRGAFLTPVNARLDALERRVARLDRRDL
jgi:O2-independent ubiquinone biosynthesis accessory factor UbiT